MKDDSWGTSYEPPQLSGPSELYQTPVLLDVQELGDDLEVCTRGGREDPFDLDADDEAPAPAEGEGPQLKHAIVVV